MLDDFARVLDVAVVRFEALTAGREADLVDGTMEVLRHLANVSHQFVIDFVQDGPTM